MTGSGPQDQNRTLKPLTKAAAQKLGHVLWIEDDNAQRAYRRMAEGIEKAPYNCAIWANAGRQIDPTHLSLIREWRAANNLRSPDNHVEYRSLRTKMALAKIADEDLLLRVPGYLTSYFNSVTNLNAAKPGAKKITAILEYQARQMASDLVQSLPVYDIRASVRAMKTTSDTALDFAHTDGKGYVGRNLRFLQSLASPSTCIVANNDATLAELHPGLYGFRARQDKSVTFWQAPENSVVLITNELHHCQPILHSEAPTMPGKKPVPRTVLVCDLST